MTSLSRNLYPGDIIVTADPFIHLLALDCRASFCDNCFQQRDDLKRCSGCKFFHYCNPSCQRQDWKSFHKNGECLMYQRAQQLDSKLLTDQPSQVVLRCYLLLKMRPESSVKPFPLADGRERSFSDLLTHEDEMAASYRSAANKNRIAAILSQLIPDLDRKLMRDIHNRIAINGHVICGPFLKEMGAGLYIPASVYNHSCRPNAAAVWNGVTMQLRAMEQISAGKEILINYLDLAERKVSRINWLAERYFFTCTCDRCTRQEDKEDTELVQHAVTSKQDYQTLVEICVSQDADSKSHKEFLNDAVSRIPTLQQLYGFHHPVVTNVLILTALVVTKSPCVDGKEFTSMQKLTRMLHQHLLITHGLYHPQYKEFETLFNAFL